MRVRMKSGCKTHLAILYAPGQEFDYELGEGVPLPAFLEPVNPEDDKQRPVELINGRPSAASPTTLAGLDPLGDL